MAMKLHSNFEFFFTSHMKCPLAAILVIILTPVPEHMMPTTFLGIVYSRFRIIHYKNFLYVILCACEHEKHANLPSLVPRLFHTQGKSLGTRLGNGPIFSA